MPRSTTSPAGPEVGVGTVYRHFPTKEALLQALAADRFIRLAEWAREALEAPDGWEGFCGFLRRSAELGANDRLLSEAMAERRAVQGAQHERDELMEVRRRWSSEPRRLASCAPRSVPEDMPSLMCGLGRATGAGAFARDELGALSGDHPRRPARPGRLTAPAHPGDS